MSATKPAEQSISPADTVPALTVAEWNVIRFEATPAALPLVVRAGAAAGAWELPRDRSECPCCGMPKGEA